MRRMMRPRGGSRSARVPSFQLARRGLRCERSVFHPRSFRARSDRFCRMADDHSPPHLTCGWTTSRCVVGAGAHRARDQQRAPLGLVVVWHGLQRELMHMNIGRTPCSET